MKVVRVIIGSDEWHPWYFADAEADLFGESGDGWRRDMPEKDWDDYLRVYKEYHDWQVKLRVLIGEQPNGGTWGAPG